MLSEFELISTYFNRVVKVKKAKLGIGDDCALLKINPNMELAISTDMLVEGQHFFKKTGPEALGHKCLAVNLSDLAAMGARPIAFTLALALPEANSQWLKKFSDGLLKLANEQNCELIGGDTTKGPLTISITIFGEIQSGQALKRSQAQINDDIWISGTIGNARLALAVHRKEIILSIADYNNISANMHKPIPRISLGIALRKIANAAIDISDGMIGDLRHILKCSNVGATIYVDELPMSQILQKQPLIIRRNFSLFGGDDYELCFTAPIKSRKDVLIAAHNTLNSVTRVGYITSNLKLNLIDSKNLPIDINITSFDHFKK